VKHNPALRSLFIAEIEEEIFLAANLPVEVDPPSAAASFRNHNLLLMIKKVK